MKNEQEFNRYRNAGRKVILERGISTGKEVTHVGNNGSYPITIRKCIFEDNAFAMISCLERKQKGPSVQLGVPRSRQRPGGWKACWVKMEFVSV